MMDLQEREAELCYASLERDLTLEESEELDQIHQQLLYEDYEDVDGTEVYEDEDEVEETSEEVFGVDFGDGLEEDQFVDDDPESFTKWLREAY